jgi:hypothetical protein
LAALVAAACATRRRRLRRAALIIGGASLGLLALVVDFLAIASTLPELTRNELLVVLLPTDFLLCFLDGRRLRAYLVMRMALLVPVAVAGPLGLLAQPLWAPLALVAGVVAPALAFDLLRTASGGEPR